MKKQTNRFLSVLLSVLILVSTLVPTLMISTSALSQKDAINAIKEALNGFEITETVFQPHYMLSGSSWVENTGKAAFANINDTSVTEDMIGESFTTTSNTTTLSYRKTYRATEDKNTENTQEYIDIDKYKEFYIYYKVNGTVGASDKIVLTYQSPYISASDSSKTISSADLSSQWQKCTITVDELNTALTELQNTVSTYNISRIKVENKLSNGVTVQFGSLVGVQSLHGLDLSDTSAWTLADWYEAGSSVDLDNISIENSKKEALKTALSNAKTLLMETDEGKIALIKSAWSKLKLTKTLIEPNMKYDGTNFVAAENISTTGLANNDDIKDASIEMLGSAYAVMSDVKASSFSTKKMGGNTWFYNTNSGGTRDDKNLISLADYEKIFVYFKVKNNGSGTVDQKLNFALRTQTSTKIGYFETPAFDVSTAKDSWACLTLTREQMETFVTTHNGNGNWVNWTGNGADKLQVSYIGIYSDKEFGDMTLLTGSVMGVQTFKSAFGFEISDTENWSLDDWITKSLEFDFSEYEGGNKVNELLFTFDEYAAQRLIKAWSELTVTETLIEPTVKYIGAPTNWQTIENYSTADIEQNTDLTGATTEMLGDKYAVISGVNKTTFKGVGSGGTHGVNSLVYDTGKFFGSKNDSNAIKLANYDEIYIYFKVKNNGGMSTYPKLNVSLRYGSGIGYIHTKSFDVTAAKDGWACFTLTKEEVKAYLEDAAKASGKNWNNWEQYAGNDWKVSNIILYSDADFGEMTLLTGSVMGVGNAKLPDGYENWSDSKLLQEANKLDVTKYGNTDEFVAARTALAAVFADDPDYLESEIIEAWKNIGAKSKEIVIADAFSGAYTTNTANDYLVHPTTGENFSYNGSQFLGENGQPLANSPTRKFTALESKENYTETDGYTVKVFEPNDEYKLSSSATNYSSTAPLERTWVNLTNGTYNKSNAIALDNYIELYYYYTTKASAQGNIIYRYSSNSDNTSNPGTSGSWKRYDLLNGNVSGKMLTKIDIQKIEPNSNFKITQLIGRRRLSLPADYDKYNLADWVYAAEQIDYSKYEESATLNTLISLAQNYVEKNNLEYATNYYAEAGDYITADEYASYGTNLLASRAEYASLKRNGKKMTWDLYCDQNYRYSKLVDGKFNSNYWFYTNQKFNKNDGSIYVQLNFDLGGLYTLDKFFVSHQMEALLISWGLSQGAYEVYASRNSYDVDWAENKILSYDNSQDSINGTTACQTFTFKKGIVARYVSLRITEAYTDWEKAEKNTSGSDNRYVRLSEVGVFGTPYTEPIVPANIIQNVAVSAYRTDSQGNHTKLSDEEFGKAEAKMLYDGDYTQGVGIAKNNCQVDFVYNLSKTQKINNITVKAASKSIKQLNIYASSAEIGVWDEAMLVHMYQGSATDTITYNIPLETRYLRFSLVDSNGNNVDISEFEVMGTSDNVLSYYNLLANNSSTMVSTYLQDKATGDIEGIEPTANRFTASSKKGATLDNMSDMDNSTVYDFYMGTKNTKSMNFLIDLSGLCSIDNITFVSGGSDKYWPSKMNFYLGDDDTAIFDKGAKPIKSYTDIEADGLYSYDFATTTTRYVRVEVLSNNGTYFDDNLLTAVAELQINGVRVSGTVSGDAVAVFTDPETGVRVEIVALNEDDVYEGVTSIKVEPRDVTANEISKAGEFGVGFNGKAYKVTLLDYAGKKVTDVGGRQVRICLPVSAELSQTGYVANLSNGNVGLFEHYPSTLNGVNYLVVTVSDLTDITCAIVEFVAETDDDFVEDTDSSDVTESVEDTELTPEEDDDSATTGGGKKKYYKKVITPGGEISTWIIILIVVVSLIVVAIIVLLIIFRKKIFKRKA